ncbi:MAG: hypothetical protein ACJ8FY_06690 [Gemmataceae bacterium]
MIIYGRPIIIGTVTASNASLRGREKWASPESQSDVQRLED